MKNDILIKYKIKKERKYIYIFGYEFVANNKNKCKYIYEDKQYELTQKFDLTNYDKSKDILEIKLIDIKNITNMTYLFYYCDSLVDVPDISDWNTSNITNMSYIFCHCKSLISLPDISKWNTSNVNYMQCIFWNCVSLISLPNIS